MGPLRRIHDVIAKRTGLSPLEFQGMRLGHHATERRGHKDWARWYEAIVWELIGGEYVAQAIMRTTRSDEVSHHHAVFCNDKASVGRAFRSFPHLAFVRGAALREPTTLRQDMLLQGMHANYLEGVSRLYEDLGPDWANGPEEKRWYLAYRGADSAYMLVTDGDWIDATQAMDDRSGLVAFRTRDEAAAACLASSRFGVVDVEPFAFE